MYIIIIDYLDKQVLPLLMMKFKTLSYNWWFYLLRSIPRLLISKNRLRMKNFRWENEIQHKSNETRRSHSSPSLSSSPSYIIYVSLIPSSFVGRYREKNVKNVVFHFVNVVWIPQKTMTLNSRLRKDNLMSISTY